MPGRTKPRWSRLLTGGAAQTVSLPALIAGLIASSAMVCVGPPLLASPAGSSSGCVVPDEGRVLVVAGGGPAWAMAPPSPLTLLPEKVLLVTIRKFKLEMAPPAVLLLLAEKLLLVTVAVPPFKMAPPPKVPWLPEKLLLVTIRVPMAPLTTAQPLGELLPE